MKQGWEIKKLGEVCTIKGRIGFRGYTRNDLVPQGEGAITLSPSNITNDVLLFDKCQYISWSKYEESPEIQIFEGDIIYAKTASVGKVALVKYLPEKATINPQFVVFKEILCNASYLYYAVRGEWFKHQISQITNGVAIPTVSQSNMANLWIPVPERAEQERIVGELDCLSGIIANKRAQLRELDTLAQSIFYTMFGDPITNDKCWQTKKLGDVATYINGYAFKPEHWTDEGMPIIRIQNLNNQDAGYNYCNMDIPKKFIVEYGDILISWSASLGVYEWVGKRSYLNQHIFKVVFDKYNINKYFFRYIVSGNLNEMIKNVHGATMKHIVKKDFDNTKIITPPIDLQQQFAEKIENIERQKELITKSIKETEDLFNSRMSYYFD